MSNRTKYSIWSLLRHAGSDHQQWPRAWRNAEPKTSYDVVIIGGGGHGLSTAYYLAKEHGVQNIAVLERGWLGGGNTGRNTTVLRSNYLHEESAGIYELSLKMWQGLSRELNFNMMFSQRGVLAVAHDRHGLYELQRRVVAIRLHGIDSRLLTPRQVKALCPIIDISPHVRHPVTGGMLQPRGGIARHDAVAWGYARAADRRGVDIIQGCEVIGLRCEDGRVVGVETNRGYIRAAKVATAVAGHSSVLAAMAGLRLPLETTPLQALVTEPVKPVLHTVVMSKAKHVYVSQSDKGELVVGATRDGYNAYVHRGSISIIEEQMAGLKALFPIFSRLRMMRQWAGIVDISPDASPIIGKTSVRGFYINCGWGMGGFKATPGAGWVYAHTIARDEPHPIVAPFGIERFASGRLIDEQSAVGGWAH